MKLSRSIHISQNGITSSFLWLSNIPLYSIVYIYTNLLYLAHSNNFGLGHITCSVLPSDGLLHELLWPVGFYRNDISRMHKENACSLGLAFMCLFHHQEKNMLFLACQSAEKDDRLCGTEAH